MNAREANTYPNESGRNAVIEDSNTTNDALITSELQVLVQEMQPRSGMVLMKVHEIPPHHLPMQNLEKISSKTSSVTSAPQTSPKAKVADLKSIVQKSNGRSPLILSWTCTSDS